MNEQCIFEEHQKQKQRSISRTEHALHKKYYLLKKPLLMSIIHIYASCSNQTLHFLSPPKKSFPHSLTLHRKKKIIIKKRQKNEN